MSYPTAKTLQYAVTPAQESYSAVHMFRRLGIATDFSCGPESYGPAHAVCRSPDGLLTVIAVGIKWFHVPPLKGGTFCFPDLVVDATKAMRIMAGPNPQVIAKRLS